MAVAKLNNSNTIHVMKPEEGNDSIDTFIKSSSGREAFYSRTGDTPVQWIQLLHALDQQDLPGWPLLTPLKVQLQKCDKCSREFCSSINYRRHMRVHHRWKKFNKDSTKNKDLLGAFWDKLSKDETEEILSFKDVMLEEVPGSSIIKSLTALIKKPGLSSLPQYCLRAGSSLLDIIQDSSSRIPLSSEELFSILDNASEKTFLCGTPSLMQKYIFDGEAGKVGLETKNLVACTGFLVEQKLIKAWLADKDAEALRCQKLLVEEEEAIQRRQAELLERKRRKKLRQREQKAKEQKHDEKADIKDRIDDNWEAASQAEQSCPLGRSVSDEHDFENLPGHIPLYIESFLPPEKSEDVNLGIQTEHSSRSTGTGNNGERRAVFANSRRYMARWNMPPKSQWNHTPHILHSSQNYQVPKLGTMLKHGHKDAKPVLVGNGNRKWSQKHKPEYTVESLKTGIQNEADSLLDNKKTEVLIGSIPVSLESCSHQEGSISDGVQNDCLVEYQMVKNNSQEKQNRLDSVQFATNRSTVKIWRPVNQNGIKGPVVVDIDSCEGQVDKISSNGVDQTPVSDPCPRASAIHNFGGKGNSTGLADETLHLGCSQFSSQTAKVFLAERWKATMAAQHVKLVLSTTFEPAGCVEVQNDCHIAAAQPSDNGRHCVGNAENGPVDAGTHESSNAGASKTKFRGKPLKGTKLKYTPKQRAES